MTTRKSTGAGPLRRGLSTALGALTAVVAIGAMLGVPTAASADPSSDTKQAQTNLNGLGYNAGSVDGVAGTQTKSATSAFQGDRCLSADGIIGPLTLSALSGVVKEVQTKAGIAADGLYAASTTTAVKSFQSAHSISADGIAGASTMTAMGVLRQVASCHVPGGDAARILEIAKAELGTREGSGNCVGTKPYSICAPWCAAFSTWVWRTAGVNIPWIWAVPDVYQWGVSHGKWTTQLLTAKPGDQIVFGNATNRYHIGIIDTVSGNTATVISGNTSNPANASQEGVYEKTYTLSTSNFYGLVRL
jgi:peptidoglycan hydrolase-like protein with peptidoglycan-binding domain